MSSPKKLAIRRREDLDADMAVITGAVQRDGTHLDQTAAVYLAVALLADSYRRAWDYGDVPDGTAPDVISVRYRRADGHPADIPTVHPRDTHNPRTGGAR